MSTELHARFSVAQVESGIVIVGFADDEHNTQEHLLLQRSVSPSAQDKALGHDRVHITHCDQARSAYGDIEAFVLRDGGARIVLDSTTAGAIGTQEVIEIEFPASPEAMSALRQCLELMFAAQREAFVYIGK